MQYMLLIYEPEAAYEGALAVARRAPAAPGGKVEVRPAAQY